MKLSANIDGVDFSIDTDKDSPDEMWSTAIAVLETAFKGFTSATRGAAIVCVQCEQEIVNDQTSAEPNPVWMHDGEIFCPATKPALAFSHSLSRFHVPALAGTAVPRS